MTHSIDTIAPTILIGLGGIGSEVVCKVFDKVPSNLRPLIPIHVFDTDLKDINKNKKKLGGKRTTQTSRPVTVGNYLDTKTSFSPIFQWFPAENQLVRQKTMTEGAGQIRVVSRLAYLETMESGRMANFKQQLGDMFSNNEEMGTVRVFIVCSLGGGTGAGMFLQTALYLQDLLNEYDRAHIIRGAFLLPEAYEKDIPDIQVPDTRANAYACLKELDAITRNATAQLQGHQMGPTINFEYRPEQTGKGYSELLITSKHLPYNYCFLYDRLNNSGKPLPDLDSYKKQMIDTIFLQLFSPLSNNQFSVEDNFFRTNIRAEGVNYFCGAGAARLLYPYDDLTSYFALRQAKEIIDRDWQHMDARFAEELIEYENDLNSGINRPEPDRGNRYLALVEDAWEASNNFFSAIYRSTHVLDKKGRPMDSKASLFIDAVNTLIKEVINKNDDLRQAAALCKINKQQLKEKEQAEEEISTIENNLDIYKRSIEQQFHSYKSLLINRVVGSSCNQAGSGSQESYQLNHWLLNPPLHPVAVRCFLYEVRNLLNNCLQQNREANRIRKQTIEKYKEKYDLDPDDSVVEEAAQRLVMALEQPFYQRLYHGSLFKKFIQEYQEKADEQLNILNTYKVEQLREMVLLRLKALVKQLCKNWEEFFHGLKQVKNRFSSEAGLMLVKHDQNQDPTVRYVLASQKAKEKLWKEIRPTLAGSSQLPDNLCRQIYSDQFSLFCRQEFPDREHMFLGVDNTMEAMQERATEVFHQSLYQHFKKIVGGLPQLELNLGEALRQEYALEYEKKYDEFTTYLQEVNRSLYEHAEPMIKYQNPDKLQHMTAWGINTTLKDSLSKEEFNALINLDASPTVSQNNFFPRREAQLMRSTMGLHAENLANFQAPGGLYYQAYRQHVGKLERNPEKEITPHLDKNWHNPAYLPDINQAVAKLDIRKKRRTFINGLIYQFFAVIETDRKKIWQVTINTRVDYIKQGDKPVPDSFLKMYESLGYNPALVDSILDEALEQQKSQSEDMTIEFDSSLFVRGCRQLEPGKVIMRHDGKLNLFDAILQIVNESHANFQEETNALLRVAIDEIYEFSLAMTNWGQKNTARERAKKLVDELAKNSGILKKAKDDGNAAYNGWNAIIEGYQPEPEDDSV